MGFYAVLNSSSQLVFVSRDWNTVRSTMILNPNWYYVYTEENGATDLRGKQRHDDPPAKESSLPSPEPGCGESKESNCPSCGGKQNKHLQWCPLDFTHSSGVVS